MYIFIFIRTIQGFETNEDEQHDPGTGVDVFCVKSVCVYIICIHTYVYIHMYTYNSTI